MKRKDFIRLGAIAATLGPLDSIISTTKNRLNLFNFLESSRTSKPSAVVQENFTSLLHWLTKNGWAAFLQNNLGVNLALTGDALTKELTRELDKGQLSKLMSDSNSGFDDFAGTSLIQPGFPAFSLLYHALASPRVRPAGLTVFPDLMHLDILENYIYALANWDDLKTMYNVTSNNDLVLAVFAYEYRPAFKTPHHDHADLVYSRTGIGRVGMEDMNYDKINRCFTNKPVDKGAAAKVAVVPARYGLFIAKKVKSSEIDLMTTGKFKPGDKFDDEKDSERTFLQPIRKVFENDALFNEDKLKFTEVHKSEKLAKLVEHTDLKFYKDIKPTVRTSKHLLVTDPKVTNVNSSFLVISKPEPLVRLAKENGQAMYFLVPPSVKAPGGGGYYRNRYFTSFNTQDVQDVELLVNTPNGYHHIPNSYNEPRTQPLFLNVTHEIDSTNGIGYKQVAHDEAFEEKIYAGLYHAPLFEDSICEGTVSARITVPNGSALKGMLTEVLPGYSIVTAPDFFPQVDNYDLMAFDVAPGTLENDNSNFYEGGLASLATCRLIPNPNFIPPNSNSDNQTYTAVLSSKAKNGMSGDSKFSNPKLPKGYFVSGYLPDVASSVFAPGWDITYSAAKPGSSDVYLSTEGLGSPFVEDMKLCAAANGMWPASSPDSARTYQGALDPWSRNPTAIPLLDTELGIHKNSPAGQMMGKETFGWDGVQGPFLENVGGKWKINFADLGRADVVQNALDGNVDMSKLRELTSTELINRMTCLKKCIAHLPTVNFKGYIKAPRMVAFTRWWLISAEPVEFGKANAQGWGIPKNLVGNDTSWATDKMNAKVKGNGYLYVFADVNGNKVSWNGFGRRRVDVTKLYVCQVAENPNGEPHLAIATVKSGKATWQVVS